MSAILLGLNHEDRLLSEEKDNKDNSKELKEQIIKGKNKTYVISKTLGKGTFGKVKIAYNIENKKEKYACKILLKSNIKDEDDSIRCKREMDILKKMHHVNVVRTYEIISTEDTFYIFMDFCAKGELFNYIVEQQHLSEEKSAFFYYQLVNGIEYIHNKGVCHRDLKPENLLLTEKMKLKIIDFGLSNYFNGKLLETPCGSPCYASPEMVMGNTYNGFCIDIWSSGIILYAMLCGYLPFEEVENDEYNEVLFRNIVECNVEYPNDLITPVAKDLLMRILVKDPRKRITIEGIKQHNFYLLGELLYKQTFESYGGFKEYDLFFIDDNNDDFLEKNSFMEIFKRNEKKLEENKYTDSIRENEDKSKKIKEDKKEEKKEEKKEDKNNVNNKKNIEIDKSLEKNNINKENIQKNDNNEKEKNNYKPIKEEILNNSNKKNENKNSNNKVILPNLEIENKFDNEVLNKIKQLISEQNISIKEGNNNSIQKEEKKREKERENYSYKEPINNENQKNKDKEKIINKNENNSIKDKSNALCDTKDEKPSLKQLSSPIYNNAQIPINKQQKLYENSAEKLLNLKTEQNVIKDRKPKEYSVQEDFIINLKNQNSKDINYNSQYLNTEVYPTNSRTINKNKNFYHCKLLNKKTLVDNKITFNNILKSLQSKNNYKSKTPNRYTIKKKVQVKKNILSNSITKAKDKYCSHSPGIRKFAQINNDIHLKIEKNLNFPRQSNYPLTSHNNMKNSYYLLNDNILKYFNPKNFFYNNKNSKPNKKFVPKDNNINSINSIPNKKNSKSINNGITNNINIFNNKNYVKTINSVKTNTEKESKKSVNKLLNLRSFEYCLTSNVSKKKNPIIETKIIGNNNIHNNNFNKNKNPKNQVSKKSFNSLKVNTYIPNGNLDNSKPVLIKNKHMRTNTEINNKIINNGKHKINLSTNKNKLNTKVKKNDFHNLVSHKLNYINNKDNLDNNIIINFNILKSNIFFEQQKPQKKARANKLILNANSLHNNLITPKVDRPVTESNFCSSVRNNFFNGINKSKNKNYKNIDTNQIKKSKEINQIIKSIQEMQKVQVGTNNNNKKKISSESQQIK